MDAVATARRAGRLLGLTAQLADAWARERPRGSPECKAAVAEAADLAVGRMRAVLEGEVDRLYLMAFAAANARVGVASSRPRSMNPSGAGYAAAAIAAADELEAAAAGGWWRQRARHLRRLSGDLRTSVVLLQAMTDAGAAAAADPEAVAPLVRGWNELAPTMGLSAPAMFPQFTMALRQHRTA